MPNHEPYEKTIKKAQATLEARKILLNECKQSRIFKYETQKPNQKFT